MYVLLFDVFYWMSSLIKEINNRLISKGIYVLLFYILMTLMIVQLKK